MTNLCYIQKDFRQDTLAIIQQANHFIATYEAQGLTLTLRQLYYQFVAKDLIANNQNSYNRLSGIISDGRLAGLISWTGIEDRVRSLVGRNFFDGPAAALKEQRARYLTDRWKTQDWRPEVWVEKDALIGVVGAACHDLCVDHFATRGYNSQSEQWRAGQRFARYIQDGQRPIVFHLGDHDPAGVDMTRDNQERLSMFSGVEIQVVRLALNMKQIEQYDPPPNYAKPTDSKTPAYIRQFGNASVARGWAPDSCWELDALDPAVLRRLITDAVLALRDEARWAEALKKEAAEKDLLDVMITELDPDYDPSTID